MIGFLVHRPVLAAVLGALTIAGSAVLVRLADVPPTTAAFFRCAYALPPLAVLAWYEGRRYGPRAAGQMRLAWIAGAFFAADLILWHHAINQVGAGLATVLGNTQVVVVPIAAWLFLGERPSPRVAISVPVVLVGVVLISGVIGSGAYGANPLLGVVFGVATGLAYGGFILVQRGANADLRRPAGPLFDATLSTAVICLVVGVPLGELELAPSWPSHGYLLVLALGIQFCGWLLISISLPRLPAAITSVVLTIQPVASVLLGVWILSETPSGLQLLGVAFILAGLLLATVRIRSMRQGSAPAHDPLRSDPPAG